MALLERCRIYDGDPADEWKAEAVHGWRFLRSPDWWFLTNIPAGAVLAEVPGPCVMMLTRPTRPWSIILPSGQRWGLDEDLARELLDMDAAERLVEDTGGVVLPGASD